MDVRHGTPRESDPSPRLVKSRTNAWPTPAKKFSLAAVTLRDFCLKPEDVSILWVVGTSARVRSVSRARPVMFHHVSSHWIQKPNLFVKPLERRPTNSRICPVLSCFRVLEVNLLYPTFRSFEPVTVMAPGAHDVQTLTSGDRHQHDTQLRSDRRQVDAIGSVACGDDRQRCHQLV